MRRLLLPFVFLSIAWTPAQELQAQGSSAALALEEGFHWEGLYPGMPAHAMAEGLEVADHWRRWCSSYGGARPVCTIDGTWTKYDSENIGFGIGLTADSSQVTMVTVTVNVSDPAQAEALTRPYLDRWSVKHPPLRSSVYSPTDDICFLSSQSARWGIWSIEATCWDNQRNVVRNSNSSVQRVEVTLTIWEPDR